MGNWGYKWSYISSYNWFWGAFAQSVFFGTTARPEKTLYSNTTRIRPMVNHIVPILDHRLGPQKTLCKFRAFHSLALNQKRNTYVVRCACVGMVKIP